MKENIKTKNYIDNELKSESDGDSENDIELIMKYKSDCNNNKQNFLMQ